VCFPELGPLQSGCWAGPHVSVVRISFLESSNASQATEAGDRRPSISVGEDDDTAVMSSAGKEGVLAIDCTNVASFPITGMVANQEFPFPIGTEH
jgi:hypothetical protein